MFNILRYILLSLTILITYSNFAQKSSYDVSVTSFSTSTNDEFSPIYYKNGIVFCSNLKNNSLITYRSQRGRLFNIYYVERKDSIIWKNARILSNELTTNYNDGPSTFNEEGSIIYYSRNNAINNIVKNISDPSNKLGIYSAELIDGVWSNIQPFIYNNPLYSFTTPALTSDGKRIYFSSDMPGGYGGTDLYYCDWNGESWGKPVNLGPTINTPQNEAFPFACKSGKLFFSSDGHPGSGGMDIYYSQQIDNKWINPMHLDANINSPYDDFGLITDEAFEYGYFSSNRRNKDDIYSFSTNPIEFSQCESMEKNNYCFQFYDERLNDNDSTNVLYIWEFGEGIIKKGKKVKHCFPGPGKYEVRLNIIDSIMSDSIWGKTSYKFELEKIKQGYINSPFAAIIGKPIIFDGLATNLPDFKVSDYLWNFGDGFKIRGPSVTKTFDQKGEFIVKMGLLAENDSLGYKQKICVSKKIEIYEDYQELATQAGKEINDLKEFYLNEFDIKHIKKPYELKTVKGDTGVHFDTMYMGILIYVIDDLSELQKRLIVNQLNDISNSAIIVKNSGIDTISFKTLGRIAHFLESNNDLKLKIAVHTNEYNSYRKNLAKSEKWARDIYQYFENKGIPYENIQFKGYGQSRPSINKNKNENLFLEKSRVEFIFLKNMN